MSPGSLRNRLLTMILATGLVTKDMVRPLRLGSGSAAPLRACAQGPQRKHGGDGQVESLAAHLDSCVDVMGSAGRYGRFDLSRGHRTSNLSHWSRLGCRSRIATCTLEAEILSTSLDYADCFRRGRYVHFCTRLSFDCTSMRVRTRRRLYFALTWRRVTCKILSITSCVTREP